MDFSLISFWCIVPYLCPLQIKVLVSPKMKMCLCFTLPQSILGVYDFLISDKYNQSYIKNCPGPSKRLSLITRRRCPTSSAWTASVSRSEKKVFITFKMWIFISQKRMDLQQEAFIHSAEWCMFYYRCSTLVCVFWTVEKKHPLAPL